MSSGFERFIGIDWSGASGEYQTGIQVAQLSRDGTLQPIQPPDGRLWSRRCVLNFISSLADQRTLVGLDFGFSLPWVETAAAPRWRGPRDLWAFVDSLCKAENFIYAGPIWLEEASAFRPFIKYWSPTLRYEGKLHQGGLLRQTERAAKRAGLRPKSIYRMVGPQVGAGSFAGMRVLHALAQTRGTGVAIWPFDEIGTARVVIVEIYPTAFYKMAGVFRPTSRQVKLRAHRQTVGDVLDFFGVKCQPCISESVDAIDALISAAALRALSQQPDTFRLLEGDSTAEGWIFGIRSGDRA